MGMEVQETRKLGRHEGKRRADTASSCVHVSRLHIKWQKMTKNKNESYNRTGLSKEEEFVEIITIGMEVQ